MKLSQQVMEVLDKATTDGNKLFLGDQQLDRALYQGVNKVIVALGGKWNRSAKAHIFDGDAADVIDPILDSGEYSRTKQDLGQFDSPPAVVARVMELAQIEFAMRVLEPSAGLGKISMEADDLGAEVWSYEIDEGRANSEQLTGNSCFVFCNDFLSVDPNPIFDRVVMNPPFAKQADIHHVMHAAKFLKPGGRLVSVMSASVMFRTNKLTTEFRKFVEDRKGTFEKLPDNSFASSGTTVHACIVTFVASS